MQVREHILLESSEPREVPELRTARRIHARVLLRSRLRRHVAELVLLDLCYLSVRHQRRRGSISRYVLDLRFVDPVPRLERHVPSRWIGASAAGFALTFLVAWQMAHSPGHWWEHSALTACAGLFSASVATTFVAVWRTAETVALYSAHGRARLFEFTGGLGTFRELRTFESLLTAHLKHAVAARRHDFGDHLRDEMREHSRLRELGVLSGNEYEISKRRVLAAHGMTIAQKSRPGGKRSTMTHRSPGYRGANAT